MMVGRLLYLLSYVKLRGAIVQLRGCSCWQPKPPKLPMPQSIEPIHPVQHQRSLSRFYRSPSSMLQSSWKHFFCSAGKNIKRKHDHIALHAVIWDLSSKSVLKFADYATTCGGKISTWMWMGCFCFQQATMPELWVRFYKIFWREQKGEVFFLLKKWCKKAVVSIKTLRTWI